MALAAKRYPVAPVPSILSEVIQTTDQYKSFVSLALKERLPLQEVDYRNYQTKVFTLSPTMNALLEQVAEEHYEGDEKAAFVGLSQAGIRHACANATQRQEAAHKIHVKMPFEPKSELQAKYFELVSKVLVDNRILYAEASTGIGKGRVLAATAILKARSIEGVVVVTAPTVATVEQLYDEALLVNPTGVPLAILPGASEFVDDLLLTAFLESDPAEGNEVLRQWVAAGAPPLHPQRALVKSIGASAAWLKNDLLELAGDMDVSGFTLAHDIASPSEARNIVRGIRAITGMESKVIFCTHAMLAIAQKTKWKLMPAPAMLIVDEVHLLESSVSSVSSRKLSMHTLRALLARERRAQKLSAGSAVAKAQVSAQTMTQLLKNIRTVDSGSVELTKLSLSDQIQLDRECMTLVTHLKAKACASIPTITSTVKALEGISERLQMLKRSGERSSTMCYLTYSSIKGYPSLLVGPVSVAMQLGAIWKAAQAGVVLASATLYTPTATGELKCDYLRSILNTPLDRTVVAPPVVDRAIYTIPLMHVPSKARAALLRPRKEELERKQWQAQVAQFMHESILPDAKGGVLVLCTSYVDIDGIRDQLNEQAPDLKRAVIAMERGQSFNSAERKYREAYKARERPILFGLGPAWTGVDLTDKAVAGEQDFLLTDLVIPRLPVGLNNSNTMLSRISYMGNEATANEALLMLKQGWGRLVRRSDVTHRRIWMLDGRVFDGMPWSARSSVPMFQMTSTIRRMVKDYENIIEV